MNRLTHTLIFSDHTHRDVKLWLYCDDKDRLRFKTEQPMAPDSATVALVAGCRSTNLLPEGSTVHIDRDQSGWAPDSRRWMATMDDYCGAPDSDDVMGQGANPVGALTDLVQRLAERDDAKPDSCEGGACELNEREMHRLKRMRDDATNGATHDEVIADQLELAKTYREDGAPFTATEIENAVRSFRAENLPR